LPVILQASCRSSIDIDVEEAAVVRAYVDSNLSKLFWSLKFSGKPLRTICISNSTPGLEPDVPAGISGLSLAPDLDTVNSFLNRNDDRYTVNWQLEFSQPHRIIPQTTIQEIFKQDNARNILYRKYPDCSGFLWLSRVGFNTNRTQALFFICFSPEPPGDGQGDLILMQKDSDSWGEIASHTVYIE
jgi:hypothetical protein